MRVIAGNYKGRKLNSPADDSIRPTSDRIKESVFNMLQSDITGCVFVDLFAGSGAMGIEALSRGASYAYFIDSDKESIKLIKKNTEFVTCESYNILWQDYKTFFKMLKNESVDIIYVDPPYKMESVYTDVFELAKSALSTKGLIVLECNDMIMLDNKNGYSIINRKKYGKTYIGIYKKDI